MSGFFAGPQILSHSFDEPQILSLKISRPYTLSPILDFQYCKISLNIKSMFLLLKLWNLVFFCDFISILKYLTIHKL